jgi:hypothetical protein
MAGYMATETKHVRVLEINKEHCVHIKNTYYCCTYLTCRLYYFNKLDLHFYLFFFNFKNIFGGVGCVWENTVFVVYLATLWVALDYAVLKDVQWIWKYVKGTVHWLINMLSQHIPGGTEENNEKSQLG